MHACFQRSKAKGDTPWFVHISYYSPHPPFVAPEPYHDLYDPADVSLPLRRESAQAEAAQHPLTAQSIFNQRDIPIRLGTDKKTYPGLSEADLRQARATYYGMITEVDAQIGRLTDYLKEVGAYDDTLVIFTSDHGDHLGDHWMFAKYSYFEQAFHIPLIVRDPTPEARRARGAVVDAFTESIDVMPSILERLGLEIPAQCDGHSLLPFCRGERPRGWRREYHAEFDLRSPGNGEETPPLGLEIEQCTANIIRGERYKYVHFTALPPLFFDLEEDPDEFLNLATDPAYRERVLEYAGKMLSWRMEHRSEEHTSELQSH